MKAFLPIIVLGFAIATASCSNETKKTETTATVTKDPIVTNAEELPEEPIKEKDTATNAAVASAGVELKFNLQKGKQYDYTMNFDLEQKGKERSTATTMNWNYIMEVINDDGKFKTIKATYKRIAMSMNMGAQKMSFSSDNASADKTNPMQMLNNMFGAIKGQSFLMKVDRTGEIISVEGFDKIGEAMSAQLTLPEEMKKRVLENFQSQFNDETVKETFGPSFNIFPNKKVKPGDSWQKKSSTNMSSMPLASTTTYTVKSINSNMVTLNAASNFTVKEQKGSMKGTYVVNALTGLVTSANFEQVISGEQTVTNKGKIRGKEL